MRVDFIESGIKGLNFLIKQTDMEFTLILRISHKQREKFSGKPASESNIYSSTRMELFSYLFARVEFSLMRTNIWI